MNSEETLIFKLPSIASTETICGVSFKVRGERGSKLVPVQVLAKDGAGKKLSVFSFGKGGPFFERVLTGGWQDISYEFALRREASVIELTHRVDAENGVVFDALKLTPGGFPLNPPVKAAPYFDWINSLCCEPVFEMCLSVDIAELNGCENITRYLEYSPAELVAMVPAHRPFVSPSFPHDFELEWRISHPEDLFDRKGNRVDYRLMYPVNGHDAAVNTSGKVSRYGFHITAEGKKIYTEGLMDSARVLTLWRVAEATAGEYSRSGNEEYALRAAALIYGICSSARDWPRFGKEEWNAKEERFFLPDEYEYWFTWFGTGIWYIPETGELLSFLSTVFSVVDNESVWRQLSECFDEDVRSVVTETILYFAVQSLKQDAFHRHDMWKFYHNTIGGQIRGFVAAGKVCGCPELIHYAINKAVQCLVHTFMPDGSFPESAGYMKVITGGIMRALSQVEGHSDPEGYVSRLGGVRYDEFCLLEHYPKLRMINHIMEELSFPDGTEVSAHDSFAKTVYVTGYWWEPETVSLPEHYSDPGRYLLPCFGHCSLGMGNEKQPTEAHLHFSGCYNHGHLDALNFCLWSRGEELVGDIGYTHLGGYGIGTLVHNLVLVDRFNQLSGDAGTLEIYGEFEGGTAAMADCRRVYPMVERYARGIVTLDLGEGRHIVVDVFDVRGGSSHEWMANGSLERRQDLLTHGLERIGESDNLGGGARFEQTVGLQTGSTMDPELPRETPGEQSVYLGAVYNCRTFRAANAAKIDWIPRDEMDEGMAPFIIPASEASHLALHLPYAHRSEVTTCEMPRNRYYRELQNLTKAMESWNRNLMQKVILRRKGKDLESLFWAIWEPSQGESRISVSPFEEGIGKCEGVRINADEVSVTVLYNRGVEAIGISDHGISTNARLVIITSEGNARSAHLFGGTFYEKDGERIPLAAGAVPLLGIHTNDEEQWLTAAISVEPTGKPIYVILECGESTLWLPIVETKPVGEGVVNIYIEFDPMLEYDPIGKYMKEKAFPFRAFAAEATVRFPGQKTVEL